MKPVFNRPPRTIMEVYKNLPEGTLAELIDNIIYMSPSPVKNHQQVLQTIFRRLSESIEDSGQGEIIIAPFDVYLDSTSNAVQPDISIILKGNNGHSKPNGHSMAPRILLSKFFHPEIKNMIWLRRKICTSGSA